MRAKRRASWPAAGGSNASEPGSPFAVPAGAEKVVHATGDQRRRGWAAATALLGTALTVLTLVLRHGRVGAPASGKVQVLQAAEVRPHLAAGGRKVLLRSRNAAGLWCCGRSATRSAGTTCRSWQPAARSTPCWHCSPRSRHWSRSTASSPTRSRSSSRSAPCRASCRAGGGADRFSGEGRRERDHGRAWVGCGAGDRVRLVDRRLGREGPLHRVEHRLRGGGEARCDPVQLRRPAVHAPDDRRRDRRFR